MTGSRCGAHAHICTLIHTDSCMSGLHPYLNKYIHICMHAHVFYIHTYMLPIYTDCGMFNLYKYVNTHAYTVACLATWIHTCRLMHTSY